MLFGMNVTQEERKIFTAQSKVENYRGATTWARKVLLDYCELKKQERKKK